MEPETITHGAVLVMGIVLGVAGTLAVMFGKSEAAKQRLIDRKFWPTLERVRARTGGQLGVVESLPIELDEPYWLRVPGGLPPQVAQETGDDEPYPWDDEDDYPRDEARLMAGAMRLPAEPRGNEQIAVWPTNVVGAAQASGIRQAVRQSGGKHSQAVRDADTVRLNPDAVVRAAGRVAPPGVTA